MKDSLYNELFETNAQPSNLHPVFLAQKDEISFALSKGYSRKAIWTKLKSTNKFGGCYITFCSYVTKYITRAQPKKMQTQVSSTRPRPQSKEPKSKFHWTADYDAKSLTG